jgi:hypothetical protein
LTLIQQLLIKQYFLRSFAGGAPAGQGAMKDAAQLSQL